MFTARYGLSLYIYIYNSTFCPNTVILCFVWFSEKTVIISLYRINSLDYIVEAESVYSAVRPGSLSTIALNHDC